MTQTGTPWRGDYGTGPDAWQAVVDEAVLADDPERTPHRLAEILLTIDPVLTRPRGSRRLGLPTGKPSKDQTRAIARLLLGWADRSPYDTSAGVWRVLALLNLTRYPQDPLDGGHDEVQQRVADHAEAVAAARDVGDTTLLALALIHSAVSTRDAHDPTASLCFASEAQQVVAQMPPGDDDPPPILTAAVGGRNWLPPAWEANALLATRAHMRAAKAARMLRDYERAVLERDLQIEAARRVTDSHPTLLLSAMGDRGGLARALGDITTALAVANEQARYCAEHDSLSIRRRYLVSRHSFAKYLDDWDTAFATRLERARLWVSEAFEIPDGAEVTAQMAMQAVAVFKTRADKPARTGLGNDAYQLAIDLIESERVLLSPADRAEARAWLGVAQEAWSDYGLNGLNAIGFRLLELDAIEGMAGDPLTVGREMVQYSKRWRRAIGMRRSAVEAVRWGAPGDQVILDWLLELRRGAPAVDAAFLDLGIGHWHLRAGDAAAQAEGELTVACAAWSEAVRRAQSAAAGLSVPRDDGPPLLLNAFNFIEAKQVQAEGLSRLRGAGAAEGGTVGDELAVRVSALPAIAQRFAAAGAPAQRAVTDGAYTAWLIETAELAATVGDPAAADAVAEVVRRDKVGAILFALISDPDVPTQMAALAARLVATLSATVTDADTPDDGSTAASDDGDEAEDPGERQRADTLDEQLTEALDIAGQVIGPVARTVFDPRTVLEVGCAQVLEELHPSGRAAVLSLLLTTAGDGPRLMRRLAWRTSEGTAAEHLDMVDVPDWLPDLSADTDADLFLARIDQLSEVLIPPDLLSLLAETDPDHPLALTLVPSGLLGVPFAALRITGNRLLLDLASVNTVQSLQTVLTLAHTSPADPDPAAIDLAVYDTTGLTYTAEEFAALKAYRPETQEINTLAGLQDAIGDPRVRGHVGILAMAVHGSRGIDGWSQTKRLPNGERLTAGHILQWYVPRLVVAGSCNTSIRTDQGGELGGFPMAFQLRGATTIIGTLYDVEDRATAQIMGLFYAALDAGHTPASALREAQRSWISQNRAARLTQTHRWGYLLTYGTPA